MTTVDLGGASPTRIPFGRLLRAEARKSTDTRSARGLLIGSGLAMLAATVIPLFFADGEVQRFSTYLDPMSAVLLLLLPVVLILLVTTEWTQKTVLSTFLAEPRRGRVVIAKLVWGLVFAVAAGLLALALTAGAVAAAGALGHPTAFDVSTGEALSFLAYTVLYGLLGLALATLIQHTAGAIVAYFALPIVVSIVASFLDDLGRWIDPTLAFMRVYENNWSDHLGEILTVIAVWIVVPLALGFVRTMRREIH